MRAVTSACWAVTVAILVSSSETCFCASRICWPRATRPSWDCASDFSSIKACASAAVKSPINWPCAWRFGRAGLVGLALGGALGVADGVGDLVTGVGAEVELAKGDGEAEGEADGPAVSARAPAGASIKPSPPATPRAAILTLRRDEARAATAGGGFTAL